MTIWILFAVMTGAAVMAVLWPLSRRPEAAGGPDADAAFYRDQIAEIERDMGRGLLSPREAEAARAEAGRRLLRSNAAVDHIVDKEGEPALRRRRAASTLALSIVPLLALATYGAFGSPGLPGRPATARAPADPAAMDLGQAVAQIEAHLAKSPEDGRGWEVLAPVYMRAGRFADAAKAYEAAIRALGGNADRYANLGEALVNAGDGVVSAEARAAFDKAVAADAAAPKAQFYLARAAEQDGDRAAAIGRYESLIAAAPADAPWLPLVRQRLAALQGPAVDIAAMPPADQSAAIRGMVEGLAARLEGQGGSIEEWTRLVRARMVLGEPDKAAAALAGARRALAGDPAALARLDALASSMGQEARP
ncbi:c-type cytochrome biogenesis protein CcmI [Salinarimonas soli]|uniref:C-type cytochrome biogenesis protein CcmI n=1 Tax=Salinarimonas soli TaxID=1638099 RepID=A0A5B2VG13_9HYPH|nr:c-type cytochrome biogenesis protein CcmI [Salinarimonas soli]KAA2237259.1 c-type cytochrome biogenesis protein CcmI [Salinarimonas soli]